MTDPHFILFQNKATRVRCATCPDTAPTILIGYSFTLIHGIFFCDKCAHDLERIRRGKWRAAIKNPIRVCVDCAQEFEARVGTQRRCFDCNELRAIVKRDRNNRGPVLPDATIHDS